MCLSEFHSGSSLHAGVCSLQEALYEPAIEYYTNHSKRVRRKRNRHSQAASSYPVTQPIGSVPSRPLRPEGWTVRYEYKMACFAEFRGEDEVALKYVALRNMGDVQLLMTSKALPGCVLELGDHVRLDGNPAAAHKALGGGEGPRGLH